MPLKAAVIRALNRHVLPRWRLVLRKSGADDDGYVITPHYEARLVDVLSQALAPFARDAGLAAGAEPARMAPIVRDFIALYRARPVRDNTGGCGFTGSLSLYVVARLLDPALIVESGTWQGHTAWLLAQACPGAVIHSFDIEHSNLLYREARVAYHRGDWSEAGLTAVEPLRSLIFFDDHVSHARRLAEAQARGFRRVVLDDDLAAGSLFATGIPPAPTASMLLDPEVEVGQSIEWIYRGRRHEFRMTEADARSRTLIAAYHPLPDLAAASHYRPHHGMSFVRLRD